jgi:cytochrome b561
MTKAETTGAAAPSGAATYDSTTQAVHWLVAALAVITVPLGWAIAGAPRNTPQRDLLLLLHRSAGLAILAAMVFRTGGAGTTRHHHCRLSSPGWKSLSPASRTLSSTCSLS